MARTRKQGGGVRRLPSGRWQATAISTDGARRSVGTFDSEDEARRALRGAAADVDRGITPEPMKRTPLWQDYAARQVRIRDVKATTRANYATHLRRGLAWFDGRGLGDITATDIRAWWSIKSERPVDRRNAFLLLRSILNAAVEDDLLTENPAMAIKEPSRDVAKRRPTYSIADVDAVFEHLDERHRPAFEVIFAGHLRLGEAPALSRADYDATAGTIHVHAAIDRAGTRGSTKTGNEKTIRLLASGRESLDAHLSRSPRIGTAPLLDVTRRSLGLAWERARTAAGRPEMHIHDLRHVSLTLVAQAGGSVKDIMTRAGHSSVAAAMRYQHSTAERDAEVVADVDRRVARA